MAQVLNAPREELHSAIESSAGRPPRSRCCQPDMAAARMVVTGLEEHRPYLFGFAAARLQQKEVAQDVVQEVFLSALKGVDGFAGRSSVRTWLTSILLNKIADHYRKSAREVSIDALPKTDGEDGIDALFLNNGSYIPTSQAWRNPEESLTDQRFCDVLEAGLARLSANAGRAFLLRELMGLSIAEICNELQVSRTNCYVLLHRARLRLRAFLEELGFTTAGRGATQVSAQSGVLAAQVSARRNSYSWPRAPRRRSFTVQP